MPFDGVLDPPTLDGIFRVDDPDAGYGSAPEETTFILAHAVGPLRPPSPGNAWLDLTPGETVKIDGVAYEVERAIDVPKSEIAQAPIWKHHAGRVVLATCVPHRDGSTATENHIVILQKKEQS